MQVTEINIYHTYQLDIEDGNITYNVTAAESDFGWDFHIINVDSCEEVDADTELYSKLVEVAQDAIDNPIF